MKDIQNNIDLDIGQGHESVLLHEVINYLKPVSNGCYLDGTFGAGGYSSAILEQCDCSLYAFDQDPNVSPYVNKMKLKYGDRFNFIANNFANITKECGGKKFDGIVLDLGVSSMQLDKAARGFSFMQEGPLDMRMGQSALSAAQVVNEYDQEQLADIIFNYGEERLARKIARNIVEARGIKPINTTLELAQIVYKTYGRSYGKINPATKTFQAIRIHVNEELKSLEDFLHNLKSLLQDGGKIIIVSFHSLEDSIVKKFFKEHSAKKVARSKYAKSLLPADGDSWLEIITKRPITPSKQEIISNIRSRSAKMRVARKMCGVEK